LKSALLVALIGVLLQPVLPGFSQTRYDTEIDDARVQLEELKQQAEASRRRARQFADQEKGVLGNLRQAEEALGATRKYIRKLDSRQATVQQDLRQTVVELSWAQDELTSRRGELARRLRYSYMYSKARALEVVFSADSFPNLLQRTAFLNRVLQQDRKLIEVVTDRKGEVHVKLANLERQRSELQTLQDEKQTEEAQYQALKQEREENLATVRGQKSAHQAAARELDLAASQLGAVLTELERKRQEALRRNNRVVTELDRKNFEKNRGRLPWPVRGDVVTRFGRQEHPKYKTVTISNGIDISASEGTAVEAVGDGVVDLARWLPGYGQTVIVNHGRGYYSVYGHLATIAVSPDDPVQPGQRLGTVGDTGSLKGTVLHFEVRHGGTAEDPEGWLR
jgi:septal ring factor EnvC (AmiA/AmiB activator)